MRHRFNCGDLVYCTTDPRHVGRIHAIEYNTIAIVRWIERGLYEDVHIELLARAQQEQLS
jgi:hypothetical protein